MSLIPVDEALGRLKALIEPLGVEDVPLAEAHGRVLAIDLAAKRSQPPFDASAMDGYAVRASDLQSLPATLKVIEEIPAGTMPRYAIGPGQAARIFTGSPVPNDADAIVIQENTTYADKTQSVTVNKAVEEGAHIRKSGVDFCEGDVLLQAGQVLTPQRIALAASMNLNLLHVTRRPRVAILSTGDELVVPGETPGPGQIIASNGVGLAAWVEAHGAVPLNMGIFPDDPGTIAKALRDLEGVDIVITIGGASVGDHDHVADAVKAAGGTIDFWRIAMKPGKPVMAGKLGHALLVGLPGNPVSAFVSAEVLLRPAISIMSFRGKLGPEPEFVRLAAPVPATGERQEYLRARIEPGADGVSLAHPFSRQDSSLLSILADTDVLIVRPDHADALDAGSLVPAVPVTR